LCSYIFFFSSRRRHTRFSRDWSSDVCSSDLVSGGGKSTLVTGVLERLVEREFQFCVIDPEGDYAELEDAVVLGDARQQPRLAERSEERRVGKECRSRGGSCQERKKRMKGSRQ